MRSTPPARTIEDVRSIVRRLSSASALGLALCAAAAPPSQAGWAPTTRLTSSTFVHGVSTAVNARGDAAVAWLVDPWVPSAQPGALQVRVAYRRGWGGGFFTRTVARRNGFTGRGPSVVLDARGELTVTWLDQAITRTGPNTVRATSRTPAGRWSSVQAIGRTASTAYAFPTVAAAPNGAVLLTYNSPSQATSGAAAVWRSPGHRFGPVHALPTGKGGLLQQPTTLFDTDGRAYVAGILDCGSRRAHGVLLRTLPLSRHFRPMRTVAPSPSGQLQLVLTGSGRGALAWRRVACSTNEFLTGPIYAARVFNASAGKPTVLDPQSADGPVLSGAPAGGADVSWNAFPPPNGAAITTSRLDRAGAWTAPNSPAAGWIALTADATGNQVVIKPPPLNYLKADETGARARTGLVEPAPIAPSYRAGATDGTGLIIAGGTPLVVSTWRP